MEQIQTKYQQPVIYPIHPRTQKMLNQYNIKPKNIQLIEPVGYLGFLILQKNAQLILTDSGGVQEEACILTTPCVTLRDNTERPETIQAGANTLAGTNPDKILQATEKMLNAPTNWTNPFGDGTAAKQIIEIINNYKP
jgi:UDP-N-acetylglucosamine 2-epimerase (non-hydrolysing)